MTLEKVAVMCSLTSNAPCARPFQTLVRQGEVTCYWNVHDGFQQRQRRERARQTLAKFHLWRKSEAQVTERSPIQSAFIV